MMALPQSHPWDTHWPEHIKALVKAKGYQSILDVLRAKEGAPYSVISNELGGIPQIQVISLAFEEAKAEGDLSWVVRDCLCRNIVESCGSGWGQGDDFKSNQMHALSSWISEVSGTGQNPNLKDQLRAMAREILTMQLDPTWVPKSNSDPVLEKCFEQFELR